MAGPIVVWKFSDAPEELQQLSTNGGDEDWLALVPPSMKDDYIGWLEEGSSFGCFRVHRHQLKNGFIVFIGCHS